MPDNQWPRFMVFQQEKEGDPFVHNGTVHAADFELALLNARDVFSRRPEAYAMWVVPANMIYSQTKQELETERENPQAGVFGQENKSYHIFAKLTHQGQCEQIGTVDATSPEHAVSISLERFSKTNGLMWWAIPADCVYSTKIEDVDSFFSNSRSHDFKNQAFYPVLSMMQKIKGKRK